MDSSIITVTKILVRDSYNSKTEQKDQVAFESPRRTDGGHAILKFEESKA